MKLAPIFILLVFVLQVLSKVQVSVFRGYIDNYDNCREIEKNQTGGVMEMFKLCVTSCAHDEWCQFFYFDLNLTCYHCSVYDYSDLYWDGRGGYGGLKSDSDMMNPQSMCPKFRTSPVDKSTENTEITTRATSTEEKETTNISQTSRSSSTNTTLPVSSATPKPTTFFHNRFETIEDMSSTTETSSTTTSRNPSTTTRKKACPDRLWNLVRNTWCVLAVRIPSRGFNQSAGLEICRRQAGNISNVIAGLEWFEELNYLKDFARKVFYESTLGIGVWINGIQTTTCTENCFPNHFTFTDPHLKNFAEYRWLPNPKGVVEYGGMGSCLQFMAPRNVSDPRFGRVSAVSCTSANDTELMRRAVLCGTWAR